MTPIQPVRLNGHDPSAYLNDAEGQHTGRAAAAQQVPAGKV